MLEEKDKKFIKAVKHNQKSLIVCGLIALILAMSWVYLAKVFLNRVGFISATQQSHGKISKIEPKTALEIKLKNIVLSNLKFEISLYQLVEITIISLISFSLLIVSMGCFIFFVINQKFLGIFKKIEETRWWFY